MKRFILILSAFFFLFSDLRADDVGNNQDTHLIDSSPQVEQNPILSVIDSSQAPSQSLSAKEQARSQAKILQTINHASLEHIFKRSNVFLKYPSFKLFANFFALKNLSLDFQKDSVANYIGRMWVREKSEKNSNLYFANRQERRCYLHKSYAKRLSEKESAILFKIFQQNLPLYYPL